MIAASRYEEDKLEGQHRAIFGSYFDVATKKWGYSCCRQLRRTKECKMPKPPLAIGSGEGLLPAGTVDSEGEDSSSSDLEGEAQQAEEENTSQAEPDPEKVKAVKAEVDRILGAPPGSPLLILNLDAAAASAPIDGHAVRRAFRRIALLLHPDKSRGVEQQLCKDALNRASDARQSWEKQNDSGKPSESGKRKRKEESAAEPAPDGGKEKQQKRRTWERRSKRDGAPADLDEHLEAQTAEAFEAPEQFVVHAFLHCLARWRQSGLDQGKQEKVFRETSAALMQIRKMLEGGAFPPDSVEKLKKVCDHLFAHEYVLANQAYLDICIGRKTWHSDVPSLIEGGCDWGSRSAGIERGRLFKQARTAQRLNSERAANATTLDDDAVKGHLTSLKRLVRIAEELGLGV